MVALEDDLSGETAWKLGRATILHTGNATTRASVRGRLRDGRLCLKRHSRTLWHHGVLLLDEFPNRANA